MTLTFTSPIRARPLSRKSCVSAALRAPASRSLRTDESASCALNRRSPVPISRLSRNSCERKSLNFSGTRNSWSLPETLARRLSPMLKSMSGPKSMLRLSSSLTANPSALMTIRPSALTSNRVTEGGPTCRSAWAKISRPSGLSSIEKAPLSRNNSISVVGILNTSLPAASMRNRNGLRV